MSYATYKDWDKGPEELLAALRNGYSQASGSLTTTEWDDETDEKHVTGYCCIGVYEEICTDRWSSVSWEDGSLEDVLPDIDYVLGTRDGEVHWLRTKVRMQDLGWTEWPLEHLLIKANDIGVTSPPFLRPIRVLEQFIEGKRDWDKDDLRVLGIS